MRLLHVLVLSLSATMAVADAPRGPRVPMQPPAKQDLPPKADPAQPIVLKAGWELLVDHDAPCIVRSFPKSRLKVMPLFLAKGEKHTFTGRFIDSEGEKTDVTFVGPLYIYRIKPAEAGECTLMVLPIGGTESDLIERLVVSGDGPRPPPKPGPDPLPQPDGPTASRLAVVVVEDTAQRTPEQGRTLLDAAVRNWFVAGKHELDVLSHKDPAVTRQGYQQYVDRVGLPAVLVFDADKAAAHEPIRRFKLPSSGAAWLTELNGAVKR